MDKVSKDLVDKMLSDTKEREAPGANGLDATSRALSDKMLMEQAAGQIALTPAAEQKHDPAADRWSFMRHAIDAAAYGKGTDEEQQKARAAWEKENPESAHLAWSIGRSTPAVLASTVLGRGILAGAEALGATGVGRFLVGTGGSNIFSRGASLATGGAGQGAVSAGYGQALGQDESIPGGALSGAVAGPVLHAIASPLLSNIGPELARTARNYMDATGVPLRLGQLGQAAPPIVRAMSRLFRMGRHDIPDLTRGLMARTGSSSRVATPEALADARADIRTAVDRAVPGANTSARNAQGQYTMSDEDVGDLFQRLGPLTRQGAQADAVREAQNQWTTVGKIERMRNNSPDELRLAGHIDPAAVRAEIMNTRGAQYPGGVPADVNALSEGANLFARPATIGPTLAHASALGTAGAAATGLVAEHALPFVEHALGVPGTAAAAGAVGSAAYGGVGAAMNNPAYLRFLLGKGYIANPLIPLAQQEGGNALAPAGNAIMREFSPISPAAGKDLLDKVSATAGQYGLDADLMTRQINQESGFKNLRPNRAGAAGIAQFIPETAKKYGVDVTDPASSIDGMGRYMRDLHARFNGNSGLALAAYNMGENGLEAAIAGKRGIPDETRQYVQSITGRPLDAWLDDYRKGVQVRPGPTSAGFSSVLAPSNAFGTPPDEAQITNALAGGQ